jgi:hypothetical protein
MIFHNSIQSYARPKTALLGMRQNLARRKKTELPGGALLWIAMGKIAGVCGLVFLIFQITSGWYLHSLGQSVALAEKNRQVLMDTNIALLAERAGMIAPRRVEISNADSLALQVPAVGQVMKYNRNTHQFARF